MKKNVIVTLGFCLCFLLIGTILSGCDLFSQTKRFQLTLQVNNAEYGTVSGAGIYDESEVVTLTATPKQGYEFVNWTNQSTLQIHSTNASTTIKMDNNKTLMANFAPIQAETFTLGWYYGIATTDNHILYICFSENGVATGYSGANPLDLIIQNFTYTTDGSTLTLISGTTSVDFTISENTLSSVNGNLGWIPAVSGLTGKTYAGFNENAGVDVSITFQNNVRCKLIEGPYEIDAPYIILGNHVYFEFHAGNFMLCILSGNQLRIVKSFVAGESEKEVLDILLILNT